MRRYVLIKHKGDMHSEIINRAASLEELRELLDKIYRFYDIYTCEPALILKIKKFNEYDIRNQLKIYNYYTVTK